MTGLFLAIVLWYFPGFNSEGLSTEDSEQLQTSFKADKIECIKWLPETANWNDAVGMVDNASQVLVNDIKAMTPEKREELVLVGHSLGCKVVAYSLVKLGKLGIPVRTAVLLAPAISSGDRNAVGLDRGCASLIVAVGENDYVLRFVYPIFANEHVADDIEAFFSQTEIKSKRCAYSKLVVPDQFLHSQSVLFPDHNSSCYIKYLSLTKTDTKGVCKIEGSGSIKVADGLHFPPRCGLGLTMLTWKLEKFNEWRNGK